LPGGRQAGSGIHVASSEAGRNQKMLRSRRQQCHGAAGGRQAGVRHGECTQAAVPAAGRQSAGRSQNAQWCRCEV